ncbi:50S ribosomal protein L15 [Candidatus Bathyarchaeota archaeon]|nr:MAG: 50S ribosomal protein L15 [Candidatus Bathyarchaeota archaeon]
MPHKLRKIRKLRGSRTCGYGRVGQHRKTGSKGYRKAGRHKHGWSYIIKYNPDYFRRRGFTSPKSLHREVNVINVGELEDLVLSLYPKKRKLSNVVLDLEKLGYDKLLGKGKVSYPLVVKVPEYSELAAKKIEEAGGKILSSQ